MDVKSYIKCRLVFNLTDFKAFIQVTCKMNLFLKIKRIEAFICLD
jgi:hypothetical protein